MDAYSSRQAMNIKRNKGQFWKNRAKLLKAKQQLQPTADIVYTKGGIMQTVPSIGKVLNKIVEPMLGLQYVWEYRSPSETVPPHYQCKLCSVSRLLQDMVAHVKSWKHNLRYLQKVHPDKIESGEEDSMKDPFLRKRIKEITLEVEKMEGRGQLRVVMKEPCTVSAFQGLPTTVPKAIPPHGPEMETNEPLFNPMFNDERCPPDLGPYEEYADDFEQLEFESFSPDRGFPGPGMSPRQYPDGPGGDFRMNNGQDRFNPDKMFDKYQGSSMAGSLMDIHVEKPFDRALPMEPKRGHDSNPLLDYLETFQIKNENDAQMVLKVTQKLTDLLMDFRLKSISSTGPSMSSLSMNSSFSSMSSSVPRSDTRHSRPLFRGRPRY
ncbi:uncharacterized protein [Nerophis lumbriciformis]|uniref:uncharacterized protein isoform X1 n=2 Tax=Nerophis lumbriciformis TaxID=546530 RepID=UPI002ADF5B98|nr:uncharacterized protein si:ch211-197h24.6 isoform X1 [Nerophis lumbriciformis]XP_061811010.1 uncharacterized protein si:ch211-197h24.6 isoform X1 [Nerophis lumbriciformis]